MAPTEGWFTLPAVFTHVLLELTSSKLSYERSPHAGRLTNRSCGS